MRIEEYDLVSKDGENLYSKAWLPEEGKEPEAVICLVHGLSEHTGRYDEFAQFFNNNQIAVFSFDLRGHGKSPGKRGHVRNYDALLDDVEGLLKIARREYNDILLFLYGQSLGGNIVSNYVTRKNTSEVAGAILSAPWLRLAFAPPPIKVKLASIMQRIYPAYTEPSDINPENLSKEPDIVKAYNEDALVQKQISSSLFFGGTKNGELAIRNAFKLTIPLLAIHGKSDKLTSWQASEEFVKNCGKIAALKLYEDVKHEPHNDTERQEILSDVHHWILNLIN